MDPRLIGYAALPLVSGFIGWITNRLAVRMIFRPRKPVRVFGLTLQGVIPRRQRELARSIGETVERELISHDDLQRVASSPSFTNQLGRAIRARLDEVLSRKLGRGPVMSVLLTGEVASSIKDLLVGEVLKQLPDAIEVVLEGMEANLSFQKVVQEKIEGFEMERLERLVYSIASRELRAIEWLGALLGFVIGLVQVSLIALTTHHAA